MAEQEMDLDSVDWDRVLSIEMLCRCGHVNVFTVTNNSCERCGLKLKYQFAFHADLNEKESGE